jgi:hypothetical protein
MMWGDEFYMYGPGRDWVGLERISHDTVMGFWKYWPDYNGIEGLFARGYDAFGVSAMYNHSFYLADLSPTDPPKSWPSMEQTGVTNVTGMIESAEEARRAHPDRSFLGAVTASFSKHRLRAFDSIWYGFALNGHCTWSRPTRPLEEYQRDFTRAFVRHHYDAHTAESAEILATVWERLDHCKSLLERANQTLHDVVGVYDTQEAGYIDNSLAGAFNVCGKLIGPSGALEPPLARIVSDARAVKGEASRMTGVIDTQRRHVGATAELDDLWWAAEKIAAHAEREILMAKTQVALTRASASGEPMSPAKRTALAAEWDAHERRVEAILANASRLYTRGDPTGFEALLRDIRSIRGWLAEPPPAASEAGAEVLIDEPFSGLDPERWLVRGEPKVGTGSLETRAPGGWANYSGVTMREVLKLDDAHPLVVEFTVTPLETGVDSQLFGSAEPTGELAYHFCFYGTRTRFGVHTQCNPGPHGWASDEAGWHPRALSPPITVGATYRVRALITRRGFRVIVHEAGTAPGAYPFWDTRAAPMDDLPEARLLFADVEPPGATASTRWGPIRVWRVR